MKLFARFFVCWVFALSSGGAYAVSGLQAADVPADIHQTH